VTPGYSKTLADAIREPLLEGATVVTATHRLSREYHNQFNALQRKEDRFAWESSDILPLNAWLNRCWQSIRFYNTPLVLLNDLQLHSLWEKIIAKDIAKDTANDIQQYDSEPLWNITATAKSAVEAWKLVNHWNIDIAECRSSFQIDHRSFYRWAEAFRQTCTEKDWVDSVTLIDTMIAVLTRLRDTADAPPVNKLIPERKIIWAGFDRITPQQNRLVSWLLEHHFEVEITPPNNNDHHRTYHSLEFQDENQQWLAAANWARTELEHNPNQRLAIVAPDIRHAREKIRHALVQVLCPSQLLQPGEESQYPFHLSLGKPVDQYPIVGDALTLLSLADPSPISYETIAKIFLSRFISGAEKELYARSRLEIWARAHLPYQFKLSDFAERVVDREDAPDCPLLFQLFLSMNELQREAARKQSFGTWSEFFRRWLAAAGWPGEKELNSDEYQTVESFHSHLSSLQSLDLVHAEVDVTTALTTLGKRLSGQTFQPQAIDVPVEVLGVLEAAGIRFDAVWFGGLIEKHWPPALNPSPFLPKSIQETAGIHQSSIELNAQFADRIQKRLLGDCARITFSRYCYDKDIQLSPSPFFPGAEKGVAPSQLSHRYRHSNLQPEWIPDDRGTAVDDTAMRGGAALIQDQSRCPFRAYARHRLNAVDNIQPALGLDASRRGSLIHSVLEKLWHSLETSTKLHDLTSGQVRELVQKCVHRSSPRYRFISGCGKRFFQSMNRWLTDLMMEWLEVERGREQHFDVIEVEKTLCLTLERIALQFKIDRIDRLADGSISLIDYKTGLPTPLSQWFGERPKSPQLPLYAIAENSAEDRPLEVLAFAYVRKGQCAFHGISHQHEFQKHVSASLKVTPLAENRTAKAIADEWDTLRSQWRQHLTGLAKDFLSGYAKVDPLDSGVCNLCDLHGLCRIMETHEEYEEQWAEEQ